MLSAEIDGAFLTMKHIVPGMRKRKCGRIIHIGLDNALRMQNMAAVAPDYCLGKAVRAWMTTAFGLGEFKQGITVNCIEPGLTAHMSFPDALKAATNDSSKLEITALEPESGKRLWHGSWLKRTKPTCHDVAEIISFLCSEAGRFISGSTIRLPMV